MIVVSGQIQARDRYQYLGSLEVMLWSDAATIKCLLLLAQVEYFPLFSCLLTTTSSRLRPFGSDASWDLSNPR